MPLWHADYLELKTIKAQQTKEKVSLFCFIYICVYWLIDWLNTSPLPAKRNSEDRKTCFRKGVLAQSHGHMWIKSGKLEDPSKSVRIPSVSHCFQWLSKNLFTKFALSHLPISLWYPRPLPLSSLSRRAHRPQLLNMSSGLVFL